MSLKYESSQEPLRVSDASFADHSPETERVMEKEWEEGERKSASVRG